MALPFGDLLSGAAKAGRSLFGELPAAAKTAAKAAALWGVASYTAIPAIESVTGWNTSLDDKTRAFVTNAVKGGSEGVGQLQSTATVGVARGLVEGTAAGVLGKSLNDPQVKQIATIAVGLIAVLFVLSLLGRR